MDHQETQPPQAAVAQTPEAVETRDEKAMADHLETNHQTRIDPELERKVVKKLDKHFIPLVMALCMYSRYNLYDKRAKYL